MEPYYISIYCTLYNECYITICDPIMGGEVSNYITFYVVIMID